MDSIQYLDSLIAGIEMGSEIPVQKSELQMLRMFIIQERLLHADRTVTGRIPSQPVKQELP